MGTFQMSDLVQENGILVMLDHLRFRRRTATITLAG